MPKVNTPIAPIYAINKPFYDVADYGNLPSTGIPDGVASNSAMIIAAANAANAAGGGIVFLGEGTWRGKSLPMYTGVYYRGVGKQATIIKLEDGANTDLFSAQTSLINLAAGYGTSPAGTLYNFGFADMTLDGNKANQSSGPSYPLRFYGYSYILQNLEVRDGYSGNILSDWNAGNTFATDSMESQWMNVKTYDSNGIGIQYGGPHDSQFVNIIPFREGSHCLHMAPNAVGSQISQLHAWYPGRNLTVSAGTDTFNRTNQSGLGTASDGQPWSLVSQASNAIASIVSNQASFAAQGGSSTHNRIHLLGSTVSGSIDVKVDFSQGGNGNNLVGPTWRFTDLNNYYDIESFSGTLYVTKFVNGSKTTIGTVLMASDSSTMQTVRVQHYGATLNVKTWIAGQAEPGSWSATYTENDLTSGQFGLSTFIQSSNGLYDNFSATNWPVYVNMLCEAADLACVNCQAESADFLQMAVLATEGFQWRGGAIFNTNVNFNADGLQIGQQAGDPVFPGQIYQSGGTALTSTPGHCTVDTISRNIGGNALYLRNDGGGSYYRLLDTGATASSNAVSGTAAFNTFLDLVAPEAHLYADGTTAKGGGSLLQHKSNQAFRVTDGTNAILNVNTYAPNVAASNLTLGSASTLYSGSGVPSNSVGNNGDFYFRTDTPGTANQRLYVKSAGAWVGIV